MAVNSSRFRTYRGRILDMDVANIMHIGGKLDSSTAVSLRIHDFPAASAQQGLTLQNVAIRNDGVANDIFVGGEIANASNAGWRVVKWDESEDTKARNINIVTAGALNFGTALGANGDGMLLAADRQFNALVFSVHTKRAGTWQDTLKYWDGASWEDLTPYLIVSPTIKTTSGGVVAADLFGTDTSNAYEQLLLFSPPQDWAKVTSTTRPTGVSDDVLDGFYPIQLLCPAAGATDWRLNSVQFGNLRSAYMRLPASSGVSGEVQHTPLCSVDEAPWLVTKTPPTAEVAAFLTVEKNNFNGTIGE